MFLLPLVYNQFKDKIKPKCTCSGCKALLQPAAGTCPKNKSTPIATGSMFSRARLTGQAGITGQSFYNIALGFRKEHLEKETGRWYWEAFRYQTCTLVAGWVVLQSKHWGRGWLLKQ